MPFGLRNAAQTFMDQVLRGISFACTYIDDVLIASATPKEHLRHLQIVFGRLATHGIVINPNKYLFGVPELDFLGHHIDQHGITPLPEKVQVVGGFPQSTPVATIYGHGDHRFRPHSSVGCIGHEACGGFCCGVGEMHSLSPPSSVEGG